MLPVTEATKLTFGLFALEPERRLAPLLDELCEWLGKELDCEIACDETPDYETLAERVQSGVIDIAWLPPIVFLRAWDSATAVVALKRGPQNATHGFGFETALVVRHDSNVSTVEGLRGCRAAWVDAWSAAGYVLPRLRLRLGGVDPTTLFKEEHFYGTHTAAIRAVLDDEADVAATYTRTNEAGEPIDGPWTEIEGAKVRVLMTFGEIPPDVIAVTNAVPEEMRAKLATALESIANDPEKSALAKRIFGSSSFGPVSLEAYEGLRTAVSISEWDDKSKA
jgi:phosphonate transport system substrate-binding protein